MTEGARHVALVTGRSAVGRSAARDISAGLTGLGFVVTEVEEGRALVETLATLRPDVVFNAADESGDGRLQGACELLGLAYTHSGLAASVLASDRHLAKMVFKAAGIPVTDHVLVNRAEAAASHVMQPPYIAKARHVGAGGEAIVVLHAEDPPPDALLAEDWASSEDILVERFLPGLTLEAFIMGDVLVGMAATTDATKNRVAETLIPAPISPKIYEDGTRLALKAHGVLGCCGVSALSLRYNDRQGFSAPVVLGMNVQPELSLVSPFVRIAARAGHAYEELLSWIVRDASCGKGS